MVGIETETRPPIIERKIGHTTYTVTSHFAETGATATDKIKRLLDIETKPKSARKSP